MIAPAAQAQIDREALARAIHESDRPGRPLDNYLDAHIYRNHADAVIAHLNAAGAAQPLPTRSQLESLRWTESQGSKSQFGKRHIEVLIAAGYAREDEPQVAEVDFDAMEVHEVIDWLDENAPGWQQFEAIRALAKVVAERGGS